MKRKVLAIILMISLLIGMIACGENTNDEDVVGDDPLGEWGFQENDIDEETMNEIIAKKNKDVEMQINPDGYTEEELAEQILPTVVGFKVGHYDGMGSGFNGNIYDIQDDYIYIVTCMHGFVIVGDEISLNSENYGMKWAKATFVTKEEVDIPLENIYVKEGVDLAVVKIDKDSLSDETLNALKSINVSNMYKENLIGKELTGYVYYSINFYKTSAIVDRISMERIYCKNGDAKNGYSGGGMFDNRGFYCGMLLTGNELPGMQYNRLISSCYDCILQLNPDY